MTDFGDRRSERTSSRKLPAPPKYCTVMGCNGDAQVVFTHVTDSGGYAVVGAGSEFTDDGKLRAGYEFNRFTARCLRCYDRERHKDSMDDRIAAEAKRLGLTPGRKGENLTEYMQRHGIDKRSLRMYERIPGSDDE